MKRLISCALFIITGLGFCCLQAQEMVKPAEPNAACIDAWQQYEKANTLWQAGWGLLGTGVYSSVVGGVLMGEWMTNAPKGGKNSAAIPAAGLTLLGAGLGAVTASIPCLVVGQVRRKTLMKECNDWNNTPELTCDEIKQRYKKGNALWSAGWGLFGVGMATVLSGGILGCYYGIYRHRYGPYSNDNLVFSQVGYAMMSVGSTVVIASIPCITIGQMQRKSALQTAEKKNCAPVSPMSFTIQSSIDGIGLAMHF